MITRFVLLAAPLALTACDDQQAPTDGPDASAAASAATPSSQVPATAAAGTAVPGDTGDMRAYDGIRADEGVQFTGTEPFWGGRVTGTALTYSTPENPDGAPISVKRFAGRAGVSWSGTWMDQPFRLAVTEGSCSDGMSDRSYPFTATLQVLGEQRQGCAWTERRSFTPPTGGT